MVKIKFENASVRDDGYGLQVNGRPLEEIISIALGTRAKDKRAYGSHVPEFCSNSCDILVIINPHSNTVKIEDDDTNWDTIEELEESVYEQFEQEVEEADPEK